MTILSFYSLDNYNDATEFFEEPNWSDIGELALNFATTGGRFGGGRLAFAGGGGVQDHGARLAISSAPSTIFFGLAIKKAANAGSEDFMRFRADGNIHVTLRFNGTTRRIDVITNPGGTIGFFYMSPTRWHWLEIKVTISDTVGEITIQVDEVQVFTATGLDNRNDAGGVFVNQIDLRNDNGTDTLYDVDDMIVHTEADFIGDIRIENLRPDGDGSQSSFTPLGGGTNSVEVDETPGPDDDTSHVESSTVGHQDLYTMDNMVGTGTTIFAVQAKAYARKDDAGARSIILLARENATTGSGATQTLITTYEWFNEIFELNPDTTAAWTLSEVNAMEIGQENV